MPDMTYTVTVTIRNPKIEARTARAIARSRRNMPKTTNHGRQHRTAV